MLRQFVSETTMAQEAERRIPSHKRIVKDIASQICSGTLSSGDIVDSERKLAERYHVCLMTARHALSELAVRGLVLRKPSIGTVVAPPKVEPNRLISYSRQMREKSLSVHSKVVRLGKIRNPDIAAQFLLPPDESITRIERLRPGQKKPLAFETTYLPAATTSKWTRSLLERSSIFSSPRADCRSNPFPTPMRRLMP